tara:strand:- start:5248 stop:5367 length:120 start_codon:yes stop_codon:yes gene_type:complete
MAKKRQLSKSKILVDSRGKLVLVLMGVSYSRHIYLKKEL